MIGHNAILEQLSFLCPRCRAQLSVPANLAGVEGPCPSCFESIRAPILEALYSEEPVLPELHQLEVSFPPAREQALNSIPHLPRNSPPDPEFNTAAQQERFFRARLAIPPQEDPLDDTWKDRHRHQRRQTRRSRRVENAAHSFLESRGFQIARVVLIMLSGAMLVWLFQYLQSHQWRLPGMTPSVAEERKSNKNVPVKPVGGNANELMSDDDTEIPAAANHLPGPGPASGRPIAGRSAP